MSQLEGKLISARGSSEDEGSREQPTQIFLHTALQLCLLKCVCSSVEKNKVGFRDFEQYRESLCQLGPVACRHTRLEGMAVHAEESGTGEGRGGGERE